MFKTLTADKDTYITDKLINKTRVVQGNVGGAGTLDVFKLYGATYSGSTPNTETSRALIHFDLDPLRSLVASGRIDVTDPSFTCKIKLKDVYGGQTTPVNFALSVFPLSASFEEGIGRDVAHYSESDVCNWLSSSYETPWHLSGCALGSSADCDYFTNVPSIGGAEITQFFKRGDEDLEVDVTPVVVSVLSGEIPDSGFRISFQNSLEVDTRTYFVKRFGSRTAYDESKRPKMILTFDDSITDDTQALTFDSPCKLTLYNTVGGSLTNILSGSSLTPITGSDCVTLKLVTPVSGGNYSLTFLGSQFSYGTTGNCPVEGTYQAEVTVLSSDPVVAAKLAVSGSVDFVPVWSSNDLSVGYVTGSTLTMRPASRKTSRSLGNYTVAIRGLRDSYRKGDEALVRLHIFDQTNPYIKVVRVPVELPGIVVRNAYYCIRDAVTNEVVVPFDDVTNSTRVSSDSDGMFFNLDTSSLTEGRTYVIDVLVSHDGTKTRYSNSSPVFRLDRNEETA
jgi:hypothetical protein